MIDNNSKSKTPLIAMSVALSLAVMKITVGIMTGSLAVISSAIDSVLDMLTSAFNFVALKKSDSPADDMHNFGHGKFEALAALMQSIIILGTGVFLVVSAWNKLQANTYEDIPSVAIYVMVISIVATAFLTIYMKRVAKATNSTVLEADAMHYAIDLYTNAGILIALVVMKFSGWTFIDPIIAGLIGIYIMYSALKLGLDVSKILLDNKIDDEDFEKINDVLNSFSEKMHCEFHDIRTRSSGNGVFIDMHMTLCRDLSLKSVHDLIDNIEEAIKKEVPNADIIIHPEPCEHETKQEKQMCCNAGYINQGLREIRGK